MIKILMLLTVLAGCGPRPYWLVKVEYEKQKFTIIDRYPDLDQCLTAAEAYNARVKIFSTKYGCNEGKF